MSNNEGMSRDALIERVRDELAGWPIGSGYYGVTVGIDEAQEMAAAVVDAVLSTAADDLDAMYCDAGVSVREENNGYMYGEDIAYLEGVEAAQRRVRGLLGKETHKTRPLPIHRTEAGYPNCATCDGGGCPDCTDPA